MEISVLPSNMALMYNSYAGTVSHISPNRVSRRFTTDRPYQNVFTDVTEVCLGSGTMAERA